VALRPNADHGLLILEVSRSHSDTPQSVGLLWTSDQLVAQPSTWQHTAPTTDRHPCPRWDSNAQSQQASGCRPTPYTARPLGPARPTFFWTTKLVMWLLDDSMHEYCPLCNCLICSRRCIMFSWRYKLKFLKITFDGVWCTDAMFYDPFIDTRPK
jgi:hypothetical protein